MCDMLNESITDWRRHAGVTAFEFSLSHEPTEDQLAKLAIGNAKYLPLFERRFREQSKHGTRNNGVSTPSNTNALYLVGDGYTYPDFRLWELLEEITPHRQDTWSECYPLLELYHQQMSEHPALKVFMASDRRKSKTQDGIEGYKATVMATL